MSDHLALQTATDLCASVQQKLTPLATLTFSSRINSANIKPIELSPVGQKIQDLISMLQANMDPKLERTWPSSDTHEPRVTNAPQTEARKARATGDVEADESTDEKSSAVTNEEHEEVSGGRRPDPVFGLTEEG